MDRPSLPKIAIAFRSGQSDASLEYQSLLAQYKYSISCSMSRKGSCGDKAMMERFFLNLKWNACGNVTMPLTARFSMILLITS